MRIGMYPSLPPIRSNTKRVGRSARRAMCIGMYLRTRWTSFVAYRAIDEISRIRKAI